MFVPKKSKYKKQQKGKNFNRISILIKNSFKTYNKFFLRSKESGRITSIQLKSLKQAINKIVKKNGRVIFFCFPQTPITVKPIEVRMGKGKGNVSAWISKIKVGQNICKIESNSLTVARNALNYAKIRLPVKTQIYIN